MGAMKLASKQMQLYFAWLICTDDGAYNKRRQGNETLYHKQIVISYVLCEIDLEYCLLCFL